MFSHLFFLQHRDIESNHGPKKGKIKYLSCCHWNVNGSLAQNMCKISIIEEIEAYNSLYNYDLICISETYFHSSILEGNRNFQLNRYHLIRSDHSSNTVYRSPSQDNTEFQNFLSDFDELLSKTTSSNSLFRYS